jgi:hypothetical protein
MTMDEARAVLNKLEGELAEAKDRKLQSAIDMQKASAAAGSCPIGERLRHAHALKQLNNVVDAAGRLVLSLEKQLVEARRRVALAEAQSAGVEARKAAESDTQVHNKIFEVRCPDGRLVRHWHGSLEALQRALLPGYTVAGWVLGADREGKGGFSVSAEMDGAAVRTFADAVARSIESARV